MILQLSLLLIENNNIQHLVYQQYQIPTNLDRWDKQIEPSTNGQYNDSNSYGNMEGEPISVNEDHHVTNTFVLVIV